MSALSITDKILSEVDINKSLQLFSDNIMSGNYSEAGNLLRENKLSGTGYIVSQALSGFFESDKLRVEGNMRTKCMMMKIATEVVKSQDKFMSMIGQSIDEDRKLIAAINDSMDDTKKKHAELVSRYMDFSFQIALETDPALIEQKVKLAGMLEKTLDSMAEMNIRQGESLKEIARTRGINPDLVEKCFENSQKIIGHVMDAVKDIAAVELSSFQMITKAFTDVVTAKLGRPPSDGSDAVAGAIAAESKPTSAHAMLTDGTAAETGTGSDAGAGAGAGESRAVAPST